LYGTTSGGGSVGGGTVFKLSRKGSGWTFSTIYNFTGGSDGGSPYGGVVFGPNGALYGSTEGGGSGSEGTIFELRPPITVCKAIQCFFGLFPLYAFQGGSDGAHPLYEDLVFDGKGNIYGTTVAGGGPSNGGTVFQLTPSGKETVLHSFGNGSDGSGPQSGLVLDASGNLYGTTLVGGLYTCDVSNCGTVFQLTPSGAETIIYNFMGQNDGGYPFDAPIIDKAGNLYGTASSYGQNSGGVVFQMTPSSGGWMYSVIYALPNSCGSHAAVTMDTSGNLYGVCYQNGKYNRGFVFELTNSNGTWMLQGLYDFTGGSDGENPTYAPVTLDASGNIYGTVPAGGDVNCQCGVVWEIMP
jgi:uncharacterized repeat protein (TIGR03803 family)